MPRRPLALMCALLAAAPLAAQHVEGGAGVGLALPLYAFKQTAKVGSLGSVNLEVQPGAWPVSLRLDAEYAEFRGKPTSTFVYPRHRIRGLGLSVEYAFDGGEESPWRGWAYGGPGAYYDVVDRGVPEIPSFGRTYVGLQVGVGGGYRIGILSPYVELQFQSIYRPAPADKLLAVVVGGRIGKRLFR